MPTADQLASRQTLTEFIDRVGRPIRRAAKHIKSDWFGRPDAELQGYIELGSAIKEIEDTRGYRLIMGQTEREIEWAREQLEVGKLNGVELRMYLRALRFLKEFVLTVQKNADISQSVLSERPAEIGRDLHVRNATVGERY